MSEETETGTQTLQSSFETIELRLRQETESETTSDETPTDGLTLSSVDERIKQATDPILKRVEELCVLLASRTEVEYDGSSEASGSRGIISPLDLSSIGTTWWQESKRTHTGAIDSTEPPRWTTSPTMTKNSLKTITMNPSWHSWWTRSRTSPQWSRGTPKNITCSTLKCPPLKDTKNVTKSSNTCSWTTYVIFSIRSLESVSRRFLSKWITRC